MSYPFLNTSPCFQLAALNGCIWDSPGHSSKWKLHSNTFTIPKHLKALEKMLWRPPISWYCENWYLIQTNKVIRQVIWTHVKAKYEWLFWTPTLKKPVRRLELEKEDYEERRHQCHDQTETNEMVCVEKATMCHSSAVPTAWVWQQRALTWKVGLQNPICWIGITETSKWSTWNTVSSICVTYQLHFFCHSRESTFLVPLQSHVILHENHPEEFNTKRTLQMLQICDGITTLYQYQPMPCVENHYWERKSQIGSSPLERDLKCPEAKTRQTEPR